MTPPRADSADKLSAYARKRDFAATSEPAPRAPDGDGPGDRFVIQQHSATRLHWDLRLERDGTLASWALPRGVPLDPHDDRIAVRTEDHPLEYLEFHGEIPRGSYGAGTMEIWDRGTYDVHLWDDQKVEVTLHGERVAGRYGLFPIGGRGRSDDWMIHRMDPPSDPQRVPLPAQLLPMLASTGSLPSPAEDDAWAYEVKWDGVRALLWSDHGHVRIEARSGRDITERYPEVRQIGRALGAAEVLLDGELVALDERGRPRFELLQRRIHLNGDAAIRRAARAQPVTYVIFDLLHADGRSLLREPYEARRERLAALGLEGPHWRTPRHHVGNGAALLAATREQGLEGVVAKRLGSVYEPGRRSGAWRKLRNRQRQELVVGGWLPGEGRRATTLGALLLGVRDEPGGALRYAGRAGSGFTDAMLDDVLARLLARERDASPFAPGGAAVPRGARFVAPELVAEVEFTEWTSEGILRQPVFKGLREDKTAAEVVREPQPDPGGDASAAGDEAPGGPPAALRAAVGADAVEVELEGRRLRLTNWDKVLFPQTGFTKGDLISYYVRIAPTVLPHLRDRPLTLRRWPNGVDGETFYEKNSPAHRPRWVETASIFSSREGRRIDYTLAQDAPTLAWIANQAGIELHPSLSLRQRLSHPTAVVFDLDPGPPAGLPECAEVALVLHGLFERLELQCVVKTSGGKGLQVYVPLGAGGADYDRTKDFSRRIAELLERRLPELVVSRMTKRLRTGKVLVDWSQNDEHKTTVGVYSVRARERETVSTPLAWDELRAAHAAGDAAGLVFDPAAVLARVERHGDLFAPMRGLAQELPRL